MNTLQKEKEFFIAIVPEIRNIVTTYGTNVKIAQHKQVSSDYATEVDVAVEDFIVDRIKALFPEDQILAEEGHADLQIPDTRIWIIDPICGTNNLAHGMNNFCTNIALVDNKEVIASCVVDHSQNDFFYSTGDNEVYINSKHEAPQETNKGTTIDVDLGALAKIDSERKEKQTKLIARLLKDTDYMLISLNSSLSFAYVATGKLDGMVNAHNYPWDICAASFLIQQSGGIVTDLKGQPWSVFSDGAIAAKDQEIHQKLLDCYTED